MDTNVALLTCQECGSTDFEVATIVQVTTFWGKEYKEQFEREPTYNSMKKKLFCSHCGSYYKEETKHQ